MPETGDLVNRISCHHLDAIMYKLLTLTVSMQSPDGLLSCLVIWSEILTPEHTPYRPIRLYRPLGKNEKPVLVATDTVPIPIKG